MTIFASDTFTGTPTTELSAYSASWVQDTPNYSTANIGTEAGTYAVAYQSIEAIYTHSATPPSADYSVFGTISTLVASGAAYIYGVIGRKVSGADTFYLAYFDYLNSRLRLYRYTANAPTQLGSDVAATIAQGASKSLELRMTGSTIGVYLDGVVQISLSDTNIAAAGNAGLYLKNGRVTSVNDTGGMLDWSASTPSSAAVKQLLTLGAG